MGGVRWIAAQRGPTRDQLAATFRTARGAALVGAAGVGKTVMARGLAKEYLRRHPGVVSHWVSATASGRSVPFGAFSHIVEVAGTGESATLLRAARDSLCRNAPHGLFLAVDDAHNLDTLSATLVHQLAVAGSAQLLLTVRTSEPTPDAVTALWKDGIVERHDLHPFTADETDTLIAQVLGGPVESVSTTRMFDVTQGNPLYLRHLVESVVKSGALREVHGVWQLRGEMTLSPHLAALIEQHLMTMPTAVRNVLEFLAIEEPLGASDLAELTGPDAVEQAEALGVVTVADRADGLMIHPFHPLYTESIRTSLGRLASRRLRTLIVGQLSARPPDNLSGRLRMAGLALDTDSPPPAAELIALAWEAMRLGDLALGERLSRGALAQTGELAARLPLAHGLSWQGRGRDADDVLEPVDPDTLPEWDLMAWTLPKAANQFWMLGNSQDAVAYLADMRRRISEPAALHTIDALAATFEMNLGNTAEALRVAVGVLDSSAAQDLAVAWAAATATLSSARMGRLGDVDGLAARGLAAQHPGLLRFTIGLGQATAAIMAGDVGSAERLARHYVGFSEFQQPGRAIGEVLLSYTLIAKGGFADAIVLLRQAAAALTDTGYSWGPLALICLAQALGQQGRAAEAAGVLARAEESQGMRSQLYLPDLGLARAWTLAAGRDVDGAVGAARDAADAACRTGQASVALRASHDGVRLGDTSGVDRIELLDAELDCAAGRLCLAHARALAEHDGAALDSVSVDLEAAGMDAASADAAAQAAEIHAAAGHRAAEGAARARASGLSQRCGNPSTPALERVLNPTPLTGREHQVAVMVAQGMTNKAIADRMSVSVRTVEGHVYRACMKLGVADRSLLAVTVTPSAEERT